MSSMATVIWVITDGATSHLVSLDNQDRYMLYWATICGLQLNALDYHLTFLENVRGQEICHACCELLPEELM